MRSRRIIAAVRHHKFLFGLIALILVVNIAALLWVKEEERTRISRLHQTYEIKRKASLPQKADTPLVRMERTKEDLLRFAGSLPDKLMIPDVMQEVLEIMAGNRLPRVNISFAPENADFPNLMRYTTSFSVNGEYPQLKAFLAQLQNSKTLFCIEGLALSNQNGDSGPVTLQLKLALYLRSGADKEVKG